MSLERQQEHLSTTTFNGVQAETEHLLFERSKSYDGWVGIFCDLTAAEQHSLTNTAAADKKSCKRKGIRVFSDDNNIFVYFLLPNTYGQSIKDLLVRGLLYILF